MLAQEFGSGSYCSVVRGHHIGQVGFLLLKERKHKYKLE